MRKINKTLENMGGLLRIWAVPYTEISIQGNSISLVSTDNITEIYCSPDSNLLSEEPDHSSRAGVIYNTEVSGFIPGNTPGIREALAQMENREYVAIVSDGNGQFLVAGEYLCPLIFSSTFNTGKDTADRPGYHIVLRGKTYRRAIMIDNPF